MTGRTKFKRSCVNLIAIMPVNLPKNILLIANANDGSEIFFFSFVLSSVVTFENLNSILLSFLRNIEHLKILHLV